MLLEERRAALEQPWVGDVVGGGKKDDLAACQLEPPVEIGDGTQISRVLNQTGFSEPAEERSDDRNAVVGRTVIDDDQLVGWTGLRRQGLERRRQIPCVIVAGEDDAQLHRSAPGRAPSDSGAA